MKWEIKARLEPSHVLFFVFFFSGGGTNDYDGTCTHLLEGRWLIRNGSDLHRTTTLATFIAIEKNP